MAPPTSNTPATSTSTSTNTNTNTNSKTATSSNPSDNGTMTAATAHSVGEVEAIGRHCHMDFCHQLDFLPFRCGSCMHWYCLDHRTESAHKCARAGEWARNRSGIAANGTAAGATNTTKPSLLTHEQQCAHVKCKTLIDTPLTPGIPCTTCNRRYCLKHRMQEEHACSTLTPLGARPGGSGTFGAAQRERGLAALDKLRLWGASKKASVGGATASLVTKTQSPQKRRAAASVASINALKGAAKGDAKVPADKRVYLFVEASADTTKAKYPTGKFFYSGEWTVGRVLDAAAKALQVENVNNRAEGEEQRLRVFHVEAGRLLEFGEKLGSACKTGNTIVLLRGVGPPMDLIEM